MGADAGLRFSTRENSANFVRAFLLDWRAVCRRFYPCKLIYYVCSVLNGQLVHKLVEEWTRVLA